MNLIFDSKELKDRRGKIPITQQRHGRDKARWKFQLKTDDGHKVRFIDSRRLGVINFKLIQTSVGRSGVLPFIRGLITLSVKHYLRASRITLFLDIGSRKHNNCPVLFYSTFNFFLFNKLIIWIIVIGIFLWFPSFFNVTYEYHVLCH